MQSRNRPVLATFFIATVAVFVLISSLTLGCSSQKDRKDLLTSLLTTPFSSDELPSGIVAGTNWGNALGSDRYFSNAFGSDSSKPIGGVSCGIGVSGQPESSRGELTYTVYSTASDATGWFNKMKTRPDGVNGPTGLDDPSLLALEYSDPSGLDLGSQPTIGLVQVENVIIYVRLPALEYKNILNPDIGPNYDQALTQKTNTSIAAAAVAHLKKVQSLNNLHASQK